MLSVLFLLATTVGGFSYETVHLSHRTKHVASAPSGYERTWKESVETIRAKSSKDADFTRFMRRQAIRLRREYYEGATFETHDGAGSMEVYEEIWAASPDLVSVSIGYGFYEAGMAHGQSGGVSYINWSRRLHRPLRQNEVLCRPPDRALRLLALARFDNQEGLQNPDDPDGIPLEWAGASIGPDDISWNFEPYELGGYVSAGTATIPWASLKPYLCRQLAFVIGAIRAPRPPH